MEAGRELDALVAEKVMGWMNLQTDLIIETGWDLYGTNHSGEGDFLVPTYSTDIAAAWEVVELLTSYRKGIHALKFDLTAREYSGGYIGGRFKAKFSFGGGAFEDFGETAPHAICLAALRVVGVDMSPLLVPVEWVSKEELKKKYP